MKRLLLVEDDALLNKTLCYNLTEDGFAVVSAPNAQTAWGHIPVGNFDLALLDVGLPDGNGFELCRGIKALHPAVPVVFLTANDQEVDQLRGYEAGAVDYVTKPFSIVALQKKIQAMFQMLDGQKPLRDVFEDGKLLLDFTEQSGSLEGKPIALSAMELKVLNLFRKNPKQVLTRGQLLERLWDADEKFVDAHTLTTTISRIRSKIEAGGTCYIKTIYGMGYLWTGGEQA